MHRIDGFLGVLLLAFTSCSPSVRHIRRESASHAELPRGASVSIAPVTWVDLRLKATTYDAFTKGCSVGHLTQSGGYRFDEQLRTTLSAQVESYDVERYRTSTSNQVERTLLELANQRQWTLRPPAPLSEEEQLAAWQTEVGPVEMGEGNDNTHITPLKMRWGRVPVSTKADWVVVPVIIHAYSHNAGWFPGQTWGSHAGARVRVAVGIFESATGQVVFSQDLDSAFIDNPGHKHPDKYQAEALFQKVLDSWTKSFLEGAFSKTHSM